MVRLPMQRTKTDNLASESAYPVICPLPMEFGPYELINVSKKVYIFYICFLFRRVCMSLKNSIAPRTSSFVIHVPKKKPKIWKLTMRYLVFLHMDRLGQVEHQVVLSIESTDTAKNISIVGFCWNITQVCFII